MDESRDSREDQRRSPVDSRWAVLALSQVSAIGLLVLAAIYALGMLLTSSQLSDAGVPKSVALSAVQVDNVFIRGLATVVSPQGLFQIFLLGLGALLMYVAMARVERTRELRKKFGEVSRKERGLPRSRKSHVLLALAFMDFAVVLFISPLAFVAMIPAAIFFLVVFEAARLVWDYRPGPGLFVVGFIVGMVIFMASFQALEPAPLPKAEFQLRGEPEARTLDLWASPGENWQFVEDGTIVSIPNDRILEVVVTQEKRDRQDLFELVGMSD